MKDSLVSVVIASYNYGEYLNEAIESVLLQSYQNLEIHIIDDGSSDNSLSIARSFTDARVNVIAQQNMGVAATRNRGISVSTGDYIMFLDADDKIPANYIESNVHFLVDKGCDIASTDLVLFDNDSERRDSQPEFSMERMKQGNIVHVGSMIRRACLEEHTFDPNLSGRTHEDWDFFLGLALLGAKIARNPDTALLYRQHEGSRNNHEDSNEKKIEYARVYRDIVHKYSLLYPEELSYLSSTRFANFITYMNDVMIPQVREEELQKVRDSMAENHRLLNTKEYRIGSRIMWLPRAVLHRIRKRA